jgi:RNA polymerase sigma-70 factor, ECF subfamily
VLDLKAFEAFFTAYFTPLLRYSTTIVKDEDDAGDIVQQVFLKVWQQRQQIGVQTSLRAYVYQMVYHASLDHLKHQKVKRNYSETVLRNGEHFIADKTTENELLLAIDRTVKSLPEQCQKIFKMSREQHLKYHEIAAALNLSQKTVENQMGKALKILRESLISYLK